MIVECKGEHYLNKFNHEISYTIIGRWQTGDDIAEASAVHPDMIFALADVILSLGCYDFWGVTSFRCNNLEFMAIFGFDCPIDINLSASYN